MNQANGEEIRRRIDAFMADVASTSYEFERNTTIRNIQTGERVRVALAVKLGKIERGITYTSYESHKEYIETKLKEALAKRARAEIENSFAVQTALGNFGVILTRKLIPADLFQQLKKTSDVFYQSREYLDDVDDFEGEEGWFLTDAGKETIRKYAEQHMTEKERIVATEMITERTAREEKEKAAREKRSYAKSLAASIMDSEEIFQAQDGKMYSPQGEEIEDPNYPRSIYGGGHWWVIEENRILSVHNNGHDGDDWSVNTIATGGAGAWAHVLAKTEELVNKLHEIKKEME